MPSSSFDRLLAPISRVQRTVWAVFLGAIVLHAGQLLIVAATTGSREPALAVGLHLSLLVVTGGMTLAFLVLRRMLFDDCRVAHMLFTRESPSTPGTTPDSCKPDEPVELARLDASERRALAVAEWATPQFIALWAVADAIAVMGVIAGHVAANVERAAPYLIVAAILTLATPPRVEPLVRKALTSTPL
jgi:hypothetical protein